MDIRMPEMDGYETTRSIRADPRFTHLPIIALTAYTQADDRERSHAAGMNDFLTKPLNVTLLKQTLSHWVGVAIPTDT
jgi:CheY-like chemotaxis protein